MHSCMRVLACTCVCIKVCGYMREGGGERGHGRASESARVRWELGLENIPDPQHRRGTLRGLMWAEGVLH